MKKDAFIDDLAKAKNAIKTQNLDILNEVEDKLNKALLDSPRGNLPDTDPDIVSILDYIEYGRTLITKGFAEADDSGKEHIVPFSATEAQKLYEYWFGHLDSNPHDN